MPGPVLRCFAQWTRPKRAGQSRDDDQSQNAPGHAFDSPCAPMMFRGILDFNFPSHIPIAIKASSTEQKNSVKPGACTKGRDDLLDALKFAPRNSGVIRLVLFDIDGTLIRSGGAGVRAFAQTFATEFNLPAATRTVSFAGRTDVSLVREIFKQHRIEPTPANFNRFFDRYPFWLDQFLHQLEGGACEGVHEFIGELEKHETRPILGLLTGNIRLGAELKLRRYDLWKHFKTGAFADDHEERNCIAAFAQQRGNLLTGRELKGEEILVIGDTVHDIECGKSIKAKVLAVGTGGGKMDELASHKPDWTIRDLREARVHEIMNW